MCFMHREWELKFTLGKYFKNLITSVWNERKKSRLVYDLEQPHKDPYETQDEILINGVLKYIF